MRFLPLPFLSSSYFLIHLFVLAPSLFHLPQPRLPSPHWVEGEGDPSRGNFPHLPTPLSFCWYIVCPVVPASPRGEGEGDGRAIWSTQPAKVVFEPYERVRTSCAAAAPAAGEIKIRSRPNNLLLILASSVPTRATRRVFPRSIRVIWWPGTPVEMDFQSAIVHQDQLAGRKKGKKETEETIKNIPGTKTATTRALPD